MTIRTAAALDARLVLLRDRPAGEDAFRAAVQELAGDLEARIGADSLLEIALAGLSGAGPSTPSAPAARTGLSTCTSCWR